MCVQDYKILQHVKWNRRDFSGATGVFVEYPYDESRFGFVFSTTSTSNYEFSPANPVNVFSSIFRVGATGAVVTSLLFTDYGPLVWEGWQARASSSLDCTIWEGFLPVKFRDLEHYLRVGR